MTDKIDIAHNNERVTGTGCKSIDESIKRFVDNTVDALEYPSLDKIKEGAQRAPSNSTSGLLKLLGFTYDQNGIYRDFSGKMVCDIGGGIGGTANILNKSVSKLTIVDPVYKEQDMLGLLDRQITSQQGFIEGRADFLRKNPTNQSAIYDVPEMKQVKKDMEWWKNEYSTEKYPHILKNSSYGEDLEGVGTASQDYVFLNFVITKPTVKPTLVINEIDRILKKGGKLLISDNSMPTPILTYLSRYFDIKIAENSTKRFVALCIKK